MVLKEPITEGEFIIYDRDLFDEAVPIVELDLHGLGDECDCDPNIIKGNNIKTRILHKKINQGVST